MQIRIASPVPRPEKSLIVVRIVINDSRSGSLDGSSLAVGDFMTKFPMPDSAATSEPATSAEILEHALTVLLANFSSLAARGCNGLLSEAEVVKVFVPELGRRCEVL
jgi:hypothetical protein